MDGDVQNNNDPNIFRIGAEEEENENAFWEVDLGDPVQIKTIVFYNRGDCCGEDIIGAKIKLYDGSGDEIKEMEFNKADEI